MSYEEKFCDKVRAIAMDIEILSGEPSSYFEYIHSSNSLFHFMKKSQYLYDILEKKAIVPRYCKEDIGYLNLSLEGRPFNEIAVLQKCFCDIPLHRITDVLKCGVNIQKEDSYKEHSYSHTDLYGEYAIALTKSWGERSGVQPIHYLNEKSGFCKELSQAINTAISATADIDEEMANNYLSIIAFLKPLRGDMIRHNEEGEKEIITKNFHDENEWRFVPQYMESLFEPLIANPTLLSDDNMNSPINIMSSKLARENSENKHYWMGLGYGDIRYIIVPNNHARLEFIDFAMSLHGENVDKYLLISKLLVLEEIRKDW